MEITQRQKIIFKTIVEEFTRCAEPVGSKTLMELLDFPVSSATIRNEMATLEKLGRHILRAAEFRVKKATGTMLNILWKRIWMFLQRMLYSKSLVKDIIR